MAAEDSGDAGALVGAGIPATAPAYLPAVQLAHDWCDTVLRSLRQWDCDRRPGAADACPCDPRSALVEQLARHASRAAGRCWPELEPTEPLAAHELYALRYRPGHHQDWHHDRHPSNVEHGDRLAHVTLSVVVQLTDPSHYTGCRLELDAGNGQTVVAPVERGTVIVFPSDRLHRVTALESGERCSLIAFLGSQHRRR